MTASPHEPLGFAELPEPLRARVEAEFAPGERLLWASEAGPKPRDALPDPVKPGLVALVALAASLGFLWLERHLRHSLRADDGGVPIVLAIITAGVSILAALICWDLWSRRWRNDRKDNRPTYALSDRRVIIWESADRAGGIEVVSLEPNQVASVHRLEYPDGSGEIRIDLVRNFSLADDALDPLRTLVGVRDVRQVELWTRAVLLARILTDPSVRRRATNLPDILFNPDLSEEPF